MNSNTNRTFLFISIFLSIFLTTSLLGILGKGTASAAPGDVSFPDQRQSLEVGVSWLIENNQNEDGGYGKDFNSGLPASSPAATLDPIMAIASAGYNPAAPYLGRHNTPVGYLDDNAEGLVSYVEGSGGSAGKAVLALVSANQNPRDFAGEDWVLKLTSQYSQTGQYNTKDAYNQSLAILALTAVNDPVPEAAINWLKAQQAEDGSWADGFGTMKNADATAMSIMALSATGIVPGDAALDKALGFLNASQLATAGWGYGTGFGENANSTALVVQALASTGENFHDDDGTWSQNGRSPMTALLMWQNDNGAFQADFGHGPADNYFATVQSIPAVTGKSLPLPGRYEAARIAVACLATLQDPQTGGWAQFAGLGVNGAGTSRAIEAVAAFGDDPQSDRWTPGEINAVTALENQTPEYLSSGRGGRVGVVMQGVVSSGDPYDVSNFAGLDLPLAVANYLSPTGEYDDTLFGVVAHNEAMLGLLKAGYEVDPAATDFLLRAQTDGHWGGSDSNGISLNTLGRLGIAMPQAIENLSTTQASDGGWGFGVPSDPSSTSEVVQGLVQSANNPFSPAWSKVINGAVINPADVIMGQQGQNGCWPNRWGPGEDPFSTTDGIILLVQQPDWGLHDVFLPGIVR